MSVEKQLNDLTAWIKQSKFTVALTGAGISKASGIPPFRGEDGVWSKYDPNLLELNHFFRNPEKSWKFMADTFYEFLYKSRSNPAHYALAYLEENNFLHAVITQNIDCLHQAAGSKNVFEYHGGLDYLKCTSCPNRIKFNEKILHHLPPRCEKCGAVLKPDIVFFSESISPEIIREISSFIPKTELLLVIGTSAEVYPASMIPYEAKQFGAKIVEINPTATSLTDQLSNLFIAGKAEEVLPEIVKNLQNSG